MSEIFGKPLLKNATDPELGFKEIQDSVPKEPEPFISNPLRLPLDSDPGPPPGFPERPLVEPPPICELPAPVLIAPVL
jgi:hypothetical protein